MFSTLFIMDGSVKTLIRREFYKINFTLWLYCTSKTNIDTSFYEQVIFISRLNLIVLLLLLTTNNSPESTFSCLVITSRSHIFYFTIIKVSNNNKIGGIWPLAPKCRWKSAINRQQVRSDSPSATLNVLSERKTILLVKQKIRRLGAFIQKSYFMLCSPSHHATLSTNKPFVSNGYYVYRNLRSPSFRRDFQAPQSGAGGKINRVCRCWHMTMPFSSSSCVGSFKVNQTWVGVMYERLKKQFNIGGRKVILQGVWILCTRLLPSFRCGVFENLDCET